MNGDWNSARHAQAALDETYMKVALEEARAAERDGEVPVGCVILLGERVVARAANRTIADCDPTAHAEMVALRRAAAAIGNHRLLGTTVYVTIEPCAMCSGAILQARVTRLVYGADDPKGGAVRSCFAVFEHPRVNHRVEITAGVCADDAGALLQTFFASRR
ncbi:MAG TPA: tRNA adenosine(34) deaminase TadA [Candidatus Acidoferrales bacterium]|nr:tRNA adenosine(34) deaminase TadA [Candidatus Acidoferrales bacterium]